MNKETLCDIFGINPDDEEVKDKLGLNLGLIILQTETPLSSSISAIKGSRCYQDLELLREKGLLKIHREIPASESVNHKDTFLYRPTKKGIKACETYRLL